VPNIRSKPASSSFSKVYPSVAEERASNQPTGLRKLPARHASIVLPLVLSFIMTCVVSLISTLRSVGVPEGFLGIWLGAWALSWLVAFPLLLVVLPLARTVTQWLVERP
jgi:hypothetical protein